MRSNTPRTGFLSLKSTWTIVGVMLAATIIELIVPLAALILMPLTLVLGTIAVLNYVVWRRKCKRLPNYVRIAQIEMELGWDSHAQRTIQEHLLPKGLAVDLSKENNTWINVGKPIVVPQTRPGSVTMTPERLSQLSSRLSVWIAAGLSMSEMKSFYDSISRTTSAPARRAVLHDPATCEICQEMYSMRTALSRLYPPGPEFDNLWTLRK